MWSTGSAGRGPCGAASPAIRYPRMHRHRRIRGDVAIGARSHVLACPADQFAARWRVWRLEDAAKPGAGDTSSAQHGNPSLPRRLRTGILQLLARRAACGRQTGMAGQGMVPDQAAAPQPLDQLHDGRVRDLLNKRPSTLPEAGTASRTARSTGCAALRCTALTRCRVREILILPSCATAAQHLAFVQHSQ